MRTTLFSFPRDWSASRTGWGWGLLLLVVVWVIQIASRRARGESWSMAIRDWMTWAIGIAIIVWVLPRIEVRFPDGSGNEHIVGLPIRGYGLMLMQGVVGQRL